MKPVDAEKTLSEIGKEMKYAAGRYRAGLRKAFEIVRNQEVIAMLEDVAEETPPSSCSHWFIASGWYLCDNCGGRLPGGKPLPYCPHCGAKMNALEEADIE